MTAPAATGAPDARRYPRLLVVFGAGVRPGGEPSPALARRTGYAMAAAQADPGLALFCSGGVGRHGPAEAAVMARLLEGHVAGERLQLDTASRDTLESVRAAAAFAHAGGWMRVGSCTDAYHQPRVRMLFALLGLPCDPLPQAPRGPSRLWWRMRLREAAAIPYDLVAGVAAALVDRRARG